MKQWLLLALLTASFLRANGKQAEQLPADRPDALLPVHIALYETFLPVDQLRNTNDGAILAAIRDKLWSSAGGVENYRKLIAPFLDLGTLGTACNITPYLHSRPQSFANLSTPERERVIFLLSVCSGNSARREVMAVRSFYVVSSYKELEQITGVNLALNAPKEWTTQHTPQLPPSRLRYDSVHHEIVSPEQPIDYLIVGSGPAGSVLAHELRREGKRVVLVERGSFTVPGSMETRLISGLLDSRTSEDGGIFIHNGKTVGGGSQVNVDLAFAPTLPAIQARIESWRRTGRIGTDDFREDQLARAYEWVKSAIGTRPLTEAEINVNNRVLWDGALLASLHPKLYSLNTYLPGQSPSPVTDKRSSESQLLINALEDQNNPLSIIPNADVRRVLFADNESRKAIGVEVRMEAANAQDGIIADPNAFGIAPGETVKVYAKTIILTAGALGSPTVLLRSGVPNDQIGRGVVLHPSMPVLGRFNRVIDVLAGTQASVYVDNNLIDRGYAMEAMAADPAYAALMSPGPAMHTYRMVQSFPNLAGFGVMLIDSPSPGNRLVLDGKGEPIIQYQLSEADKERFRKGIAEAIRIMFLAGAKQVFLPTTENILGDSNSGRAFPQVLTDLRQAEKVEANMRLVANRSIVTSAHMQATDKMGSSPVDSVVGRDFHVWGTENLYVVDGSIFPTSIGANPMQSIYTFAKIFADNVNSRP